MVVTPKILAFSGSARKGSFNQALIDHAAKMLRERGAEVTVINLGELEMPIYNADFESSKGLPQGVQDLKALISSHHGMLISSPEHNTGIPALLKNALDWASRPAAGEQPLDSYKNKVAAIMCASPSNWAGIRNLNSVRLILSYLGALVLPQQLAIGSAHEAITPSGLKSEREQQACAAMLDSLVNLCNKLNS